MLYLFEDDELRCQQIDVFECWNFDENVEHKNHNKHREESLAHGWISCGIDGLRISLNMVSRRAHVLSCRTCLSS